jgi:RHS repeat-associated protein
MRPSLLQHPREFQAPVAGVPTTPTGYHQWHRSLAAELGRFGSRDPVGYEAGTNLVEYAWDSPTNRTDANGQQAWPPGGGWPRYEPIAPKIPSVTLINYGHYCGPNRKATCDGRSPVFGSANRPKPIDQVDTACADHDCCLQTLSEYIDPCYQHACNVRFCLALRVADCSTSPIPEHCREYAARANALCIATLFGNLPLP